ncbi:MAG: SUMF1/EgtB/PvdO family nonheme iron enzyme, partial [Nitrosarchaeum sp.]
NGNDYCYDIELPEHKTYLENYSIDAFPVTNEQYLKFIEDGGYDTYKYWLADGWEKVKNNEWKTPMYWEKIDGQWYVKDFLGIRKLNPKEPVCHVSYYEADAYCKWAGKRLPSEAEWEKAACWNEEKQQKTIFPWGNEQPTEQNANLLESFHWGCTEIGAYPNGVSPYGCHQMIGDVWEWTASEFAGYPGFKTGFEEYNDKWFTNQKVLRGGSFGTPKMSIRGSYRNFFRLDERWLFSGFRCVENI